ncbi:MAG: DEAD/DEAH box helicase [Candidatus Lokiarchaeota archaeon]|nr:DEAD/DEAH box helicase [Candidatus Lokiarchaeota archaeon]
MENLDPEIRDILYNKGIDRLYPIQKEALSYLRNDIKDNILVVAPTATGKTLIGELFLIEVINRGHKGFYLVPLKAIANEKFQSIYNKYGSMGLKVKVSTGDFELDLEDIDQYNLIITTYERFDSIIRKRPEWIKKIGIVVIDEIHNIGSKTRGANLESLITRLKKYRGIRIIGLSATVNNPEDLAQWIDGKLIYTDKRAVQLRYKILVSEDRIKAIKKLCKSLIEKGFQALVFVSKRKESENLAKILSKAVSDLISLDEREELENYSKFMISSNIDFKTIINGVGYHHAGLDFSARYFIEKIFRRKLIKILCCTTTLAAGINMPAKAVIIKNIKLFKRDAGVSLEMEMNKFHQICGRAGRHLNDIGFAIIISSDHEEAYFIKNHYFKVIKENNVNNGEIKKLIPKYDNIKSVFTINKNIPIEQTLIFIHHHSKGISRTELVNFFKNTFYFFQESKNQENIFLIEKFGFDSKNIRLLLRAMVPRMTSNEKIDISIIKIDIENLEGIVKMGKHGLNFHCGFTYEDCYCSCDDFKKNNFCQHLYNLGLYGLDKHHKYSKDLIRYSINKEFILDYLIKKDFIYKKNEIYKCTELGNLVVELFIDTRSFIFIKDSLKYIDNRYEFLDFILKLCQMKSNKSLNYHYLAVINEILNRDVDSSVKEVLRSMATKEIQIGDLERFLDLAIWYIKVIIKISENVSEGSEEINNIGKKILNGLIEEENNPIDFNFL